MDRKDVIIVLGVGISLEGVLPEIAKVWVRKGAELLKEEMAPNLLLSGAYTFWFDEAPKRMEADAMKEYAISLGVPGKVIFTETESKDTLGNAYFSKIGFLEPNNWKKVLIVCSNYRRERTEYLFRKVLGPVYEISFADEPSETNRADMYKLMEAEEASLKLAKEWLDPIGDGNDEAVKAIIYTKHPGYADNPEVSKERLAIILGKNL